MKALVIGRGWIGQKMGRLFGVAPCSHHEALTAIGYGERQDIVINCAGVVGNPTVDECEKRKAETIQGNVIFPMKVMKACHERKTPLAHFSSGCIYFGDRSFTEEDAPNFDKSLYSATKLASDEILTSNDALVFRIRMPFDASANPKNLLFKLAQYSRVARLVDSLNSISDVDEMCDVAKSLIEQRAKGPFHLVNTGTITTRQIAELMGIQARWIEWEEFYSSGHGARSVCTLSNAKAARLYPIRDVRDAVESAALAFRMAA